MMTFFNHEGSLLIEFTEFIANALTCTYLCAIKFFYICTTKKALKGNRFESNEEIQNTAKKFFKRQPQKFLIVMVVVK